MILDNYAIRANLDRSALMLRPGISGEISCTGMTNGPELEIEWYNPRGQVRICYKNVTSLINSNNILMFYIFNSKTAYSKQQTFRDQDIDNKRGPIDQSINIES